MDPISRDLLVRVEEDWWFFYSISIEGWDRYHTYSQGRGLEKDEKEAIGLGDGIEEDED
jgi:hypothetical protein